MNQLFLFIRQIQINIRLYRLYKGVYIQWINGNSRLIVPNDMGYVVEDVIKSAVETCREFGWEVEFFQEQAKLV